MNINLNDINGTPSFVIPHWRNENIKSLNYFQDTLKGIFDQTDDNWKLIIVDDCSPCQDAVDHLIELETKFRDKIKVILNTVNNGPGYCRNLGVKWAYQNNSPFVLFNDADDISHNKRLEVVRKIFSGDPDASVVYSTFSVIDENNSFVPMENTAQCIIEILNGHKTNPPQGFNAWIDIGTKTGYTNLTSTTAVRTDLAYRYPFPDEKVSEDTHTWFRYSAGGDKFVYSEEIPTLYRIPQTTIGTSTMTRVGSKFDFLDTKARIDTNGFISAINIAIAKNKINPDMRDDLMIKFHIKMSETMYKEKEYDLAKIQINNAKLISLELTENILDKKGFNKWDL
jgi:glycosyltransferase involved in cell wall biosynthesis